jgi:hypothetical protein
LNLLLVAGDGGTDGTFGGGAIGVSGSGGDVAFVIEALAKLIVGASDVALQGMAATRLVDGEIAIGSFLLWAGSSGGGWLRPAGD